MCILKTRAPAVFSDIVLTLMRFLARRLRSKSQVNCALFYTSMEFGTLIEVHQYKHFQM